jgi:hypothetical protein
MTSVFLLNIGLFIFFVLTIVFLVLYLKTKSDKIDPKNCPTTKSNLGVISNVDPSTTRFIFQCTGNADGSSGTSICQFSGYEDLYSVQQLCNKYPTNTCSGFYYDQTNKIVSFVDTSYTISSSSVENSTFGNVFIRQT